MATLSHIERLDLRLNRRAAPCGFRALFASHCSEWAVALTSSITLYLLDRTANYIILHG